MHRLLTRTLHPVLTEPLDFTHREAPLAARMALPPSPSFTNRMLMVTCNFNRCKLSITHQQDCLAQHGTAASQATFASNCRASLRAQKQKQSHDDDRWHEAKKP